MPQHASPRCAAAGALASALALAAALCAGCDSAGLKAVEQNESILAFFNSTKPLDAARWSQNPYDPDQRLRGTNLLANAPFGGEDVYVRMYRTKLGAYGEPPDPDLGVRGVAARALGMHGDPADAELILKHLQNAGKGVQAPAPDSPESQTAEQRRAADADRFFRLEAVRALQRIHNPAAVDTLIRLTRPVDPLRPDLGGEPDRSIRAEAALALGQYPQPRVAQALIAALDDEHLLVSRAAANSLQTLTGQDLGEDAAAWFAFVDGAPAPFAGRLEYVYPTFSRSQYWWEYVPLVPDPPNEIAGPPAGLGPRRDGDRPVAPERPSIPVSAPSASS